MPIDNLELLSHIELYEGQNLSSSQIAQRLAIVFDDVSITKDRVQKLVQQKKAVASNYGGGPLLSDDEWHSSHVDQDDRFFAKADQSTAEERELWKKYLNITVKQITRPIHQQSYTDYRKIVVVADLHGDPSPEITRMIVEQQPDIVIIAGDSLELAEFSRWGKPIGSSGHKNNLQQDLTNVRAFLEIILRDTDAQIGIMLGNHDVRIQAMAQELLPSELLYLFTDPFDLLLKGLGDRVEMVKTVWEYHFPDGVHKELADSQFAYQLGDAFISHMNFVGGNPGDAVKKLSIWIDKWRDTLDLGSPALLVQAHVHKVALLENDSGHRMLVEPGAAFEPHIDSYKVGYQPKWTPSCIGCVVFGQDLINDQWKTDRSTVHLLRPHRGNILPGNMK